MSNRAILLQVFPMQNQYLLKMKLFLMNVTFLINKININNICLLLDNYPNN